MITVAKCLCDLNTVGVSIGKRYHVPVEGKQEHIIHV